MEYWIMSLGYLLIFYLFSYRPNVLNSLTRHSLILFPVFMFLGQLKISQMVQFLYVSSSLVLLVLLFTYYTFGFFVG